MSYGMKFKMRGHLIFACSLKLTAVLMPMISFSQNYIVNGNAGQYNCNCFGITQPQLFQAGSVWNVNKINLTQPFDFSFNVNLGCFDPDGADGIVFILQPVSTSVGQSGGGMGFGGIIPSIGIALDTWQNLDQSDPVYDHISIQSNGHTFHDGSPNNLAGPVQASAINQNIEDCEWHILRITWDPVTKFLRTYFDGVFRLETQTDLVPTVFNNDPMVYWGFSGATGAAYNLQRFCTALNPDFSIDASNNSVCLGEPVVFEDNSVSFTTIQSFYWDFGDGTTSTDQNPPPHLYSTPGNYEVKHSFTSLDGCVADTVRKFINVGDIPVADFEVYDTCAGLQPRIVDRSNTVVGNINQWSWFLNDSLISNGMQPGLGDLPPGNYELELVLATNYGCVSDTASGSFTIRPKPEVNLIALDGCADSTISFTAQQTDNLTIVAQWYWNFNDGSSGIAPQQNSHVFTEPGFHEITLIGIDGNGCPSDPFKKRILVNHIQIEATNDTMVIRDEPFQLNVQSAYIGPVQTLNYTWTPTTGLNDASVPNPLVILQDDQEYFITVTTQEGCVDTTSIKITVFKGSAIYVPSGFTPNGDGLNELLKPRYIGISRLNYFSIYNRWGQLVYTTKSMDQGWNGIVAGRIQSGVYVWILSAEDFVGKKYQLKGTSVVIR